MGQRSVRVNELLKREVSHVLRMRYQSEAVAITITEVDISPDLRTGRIYYSVLGDEETAREAERFFARYAKAIQQESGKAITLKYQPRLRFIRDEAMARGARMMDILDTLEEEDQA